MPRSAPFSIVLLLTNFGCFGPTDLINGFVFNLPEPEFCSEDDHLLTPGDFGLEFEPFDVALPNGNIIRGWLTHAQTGAPVIGTVMFNNPSKGFQACFLPFIAVLADEGFNVVSYDYEGFGDSDGTKSIDNIAPNAEAVLSWVLDSDDPFRQSVALFGVSLGTGPSIWLAAEYPQQVWALILDSAYAIPPTMNFPSLQGLLSLLVPYAIPEFPPEMHNTTNILRTQAPLLMLHGSVDPLSTIEGAQMVFDRSPNPIGFVEFTGAGHVEAIFTEPERYEQEVFSFLESFAPAN